MSDKLAKLEPQVNSLAQPLGTSLLGAREAVQRVEPLREAFAYARANNIGAERLAEVITPMFSEHLDIPIEEAQQVARYLADEYEQIGDAVLIVSRETGRAIARVTDEDFWQPAPVPREDGSLAVPLPRLKPEIQGALVNWQFTEARDRNLLAEVLVRGRAAGIVRDVDDRKLQPITKAGRKHFVVELRDALPTLLDEYTSGGVAAFLNCFERVASDPVATRGGDIRRGVKSMVIARATLPLMDPLTSNLHHSVFASVRRQIANQWVREIAVSVSGLARRDGRAPVVLQAGDPLPRGLVWAADPAIATVVEGIALPTVGVSGAVGLAYPAGWLVLDPASYQCDAREAHDRWEIIAMFECSVWLDPQKCTTLDVQNIEHRAVLE